MGINIQKIKIAGVPVYPATVLDAVKDAKSVKIEGVETNGDYGKTLRQILDSIKENVKALSDLGLTAEDIALIATNKSAIETLNGDATKDGSIAKAIAAVKKEILTGDSNENINEAYDTLIEIGKWITDDQSGAAAISTLVGKNTTAIGEKAKAAEYYATYEEYVAAAEVEGWATEYTLKREFDDAAPDAGEKLKTGTGTAATGLYKEIEDAKQAAIDAQHSKTTVVTGTTNGTIKVDGTEVSVAGLGSAAYTDATAYDASGAADTAEQNAKDYADGLATNYDEAGAAAAVLGSTTSTVKDAMDAIGTANTAAEGLASNATGLIARIEAIEAGSVEAVATSDTTEYADVF